jgi:hypothetical protein
MKNESSDETIRTTLETVNARHGNTLKKLAESETQDRESKVEEAFHSMADLIEECDESRKEFDRHVEEWWQTLSYEDRLRAFYSVCKRIHKGDLVDQGSYRHVLYDVFNFSFDSYSIGMQCGYLDIHNSIVAKSEKEE